MSVFLLILGAVTAAAGLGLVASGVSIQEHVFDTAVLTPGVVAIVGGFLLIGLGLAVRVLQQIETTLAARPMPRTVRSAEAAPSEPAGDAASAKRPTATEPEAAQAPAPGEAAGFARLREKFPSLVRVEGAPVVEETDDVSLSPKVAARADEEADEAKGGLTIRVMPRQAASGGAPSRTARRLEAIPPPNQRERLKTSMFDSFWPKGVGNGREEQPLPAPAVIPTPVPAVESAPKAGSELGIEPPAVDYTPAVEQPARPRLAILKSGVVDGMAYTLYSDGSIEAQLPQGMLRFGSITELRNHIEQSS